MRAVVLGTRARGATDRLRHPRALGRIRAARRPLADGRGPADRRAPATSCGRAALSRRPRPRDGARARRRPRGRRRRRRSRDAADGHRRLRLPVRGRRACTTWRRPGTRAGRTRRSSSATPPPRWDRARARCAGGTSPRSRASAGDRAAAGARTTSRPPARTVRLEDLAGGDQRGDREAHRAARHPPGRGRGPGLVRQLEAPLPLRRRRARSTARCASA